MYYSFSSCPKKHISSFPVFAPSRKNEISGSKEAVLNNVVLYTNCTIARHPNHPDKQRRNRKRSSPALPNTIPIHPYLQHKHTLPLPLLPHLSASYARSTSGRHNRHRLLSARTSRRLPLNRLHRLQSRSLRLPHFPVRRNCLFACCFQSRR